MRKHLLSRALALSVSLGSLLPQNCLGAGNNSPTGVAGDFNGSVTTGGSIDPFTGNARRVIDDIVVTGSVGAYPLKWSRVLNTRGFPTVFGKGGGWSHSYLWTISVSALGEPDLPAYVVNYPDGRKLDFFYEYGSLNGYQARAGAERLDRIVDAPTGDGYNLLLRDGGRVEFRFRVPGNFYSGFQATAIVDPYGQTTTLHYDPQFRLDRVTEPAGRFLQITYRLIDGYEHDQYYSYDVIDHVEAFDGRPGNSTPTEKVQYDYDTVPVATYYRYPRLINAFYDDTSHATYTYEPGNASYGGGPSLFYPVVSTCDDQRYGGPMKQIKYKYLTSYEGGAHYQAAWGQVKAEQNYSGGSAISVAEIIYPTYQPGVENPDKNKRKEKRADGKLRYFEYNDEGVLVKITDFAQPSNASVITYVSALPTPAYKKTFTDARMNSTFTDHEPVISAVTKLTHPPSVDHPGGSTVQYSYTNNNEPYYLASKTDERDKTTHYDRDNAHRIWQIRYPDDGYETFTYNNNPFGLIYQHRLTSGGTEVFTYDARGLKKTYTPPATLSDGNPGSHPTIYTYYENEGGRPDRVDRLKSVTDPLGHTTTYDYNKRGQVTQVMHHDGKYTQSNYNSDGTLAWTADENHPNAWMDGHEYERTRYQYDEYRRVTRVTNPLGQFTISDYTPPAVNGIALSPLSHTTSSMYSVTSPMGKVIEYDHDANFQRSRMTVASGTNDASTTTYRYDEVGNLKAVRDPKGQLPGGHETVYDYDNRNRRIGATDPLGHTTAWQYDDAGNMKRETRADTKFRTWDEYDAMNRIKHTTGFLGAMEQTSYSYDLAGNLRFMTDANGGIYETLYDELNRKSNFVYPTDATNVSRSEAWRYDIAGNLTWYKNTAQQFKHFEYDNRNRQRRSFWNSSYTDTTTVNWNIGPETATALDDASRVTEIKTNNGQTIVAYGYDDANRKIWEDQTLAGLPTRRVETLPDNDGNRGTLSVAGVPDGYSFGYEYTQRGQLWHINRGGSAYFQYSYDVNLNLEKRQHMEQGGKDSTSFTYDDGNRIMLCEQRKQDGQQPFARSNYNDYDLVNNLKSVSREEDENKGERFDYDEANQLKSVSYKANIEPRPAGPEGNTVTVGELTKDEEHESLAALEADPDREPLAALTLADPDPEPNAVAGPRTVTYTNDSINRMSMEDRGTVTTYTPNLLNQYTAVTGQAAPAYDEKFNLSGYDGWSYVYDAEKRLISASAAGHDAQFVYDGLGRCVQRTVDGKATVFTYDEWKPIVEWTGGGVFVAWNLYGPGADEILVRKQPNTGGYLYYHLDAMGNVQFLLSHTGYGLEKYTYDAFGKPRITGWNGNVRATSLYGNRFMFTGREYLYTLGLYDYRHRIYHPGLGRFMQTDPVGFDGDPTNLYRYCGSNPVNRLDPTGLDWPFPSTRIISGRLELSFPSICPSFDMPTTITLSRKATTALAVAGGVTLAATGIGTAVVAVGWTTATTAVVLVGVGTEVLTHIGGHGAPDDEMPQEGTRRLPPARGPVPVGMKAIFLAQDLPTPNVTLFGRGSSTGRAFYNTGNQGWQPIGNASADIRWAKNSGTGNFEASEFTKYHMDWNSNAGEGFHPPGPN